MTDMTLRQAYEQILCPGKLLSAGSLSANRTALRWFERLTPEAAALPVGQLRSVHLAEFRARWISQSGLRPQTFNKYLRQLRAMLNELFDLDLIERMPRCRLLREDEPDVRVIPTDEIKRIHAACSIATWPRKAWVKPAQHWRALVTVAFTTGLRRNDILTIRNTDIDPARRVLVTRQQKTGKRRAIPLTRQCVDTIRPLMHADREFLFYRTASNKQFYRQWHEIQDAAGIDRKHHYGIHDLRRTCGSLVYQAAGLNAASELLAHSSLAVTRRHYIASGVVAESLRCAVDQLPSIGVLDPR